MPKFLIVDDEIVNTLLLEKILANFGECISANSGEEALTEIENEIKAESHFDIIFLDIMMPNLDGHELLQRLRKTENENNSPKSIVMMVSALDDADTVLQSFIYDCQEYITKPVRKATIVEKIQKYGFFPCSKIPLEKESMDYFNNPLY